MSTLFYKNKRLTQELKVIWFCCIANLVACTAQKNHNEHRLEVPCVFQNLQAAPVWICDQPLPELYLQAVGKAEKSAAGPNYMQDIARIAALDQLLEKLKVETTKRMQRYFIAIDGVDEQAVDALISHTLDAITRKSIANTQNINALTGPEGRLYVLVGLDSSATTVLIESYVTASINSTPALWQVVKPQKSAMTWQLALQLEEKKRKKSRPVKKIMTAKAKRKKGQQINLYHQKQKGKREK